MLGECFRSFQASSGSFWASSGSFWASSGSFWVSFGSFQASSRSFWDQDHPIWGHPRGDQVSKCVVAPTRFDHFQEVAKKYKKRQAKTSMLNFALAPIQFDDFYQKRVEGTGTILTFYHHKSEEKHGQAHRPAGRPVRVWSASRPIGGTPNGWA